MYFAMLLENTTIVWDIVTFLKNVAIGQFF